jgi:hypothetical protein
MLTFSKSWFQATHLQEDVKRNTHTYAVLYLYQINNLLRSGMKMGIIDSLLLYKLALFFSTYMAPPRM